MVKALTQSLKKKKDYFRNVNTALPWKYGMKFALQCGVLRGARVNKYPAG